MLAYMLATVIGGLLALALHYLFEQHECTSNIEVEMEEREESEKIRVNVREADSEYDY